ncbi:MAG: class I SAM-dependent methyltransferase [Candidatus Bathyarchaeales archaeon]
MQGKSEDVNHYFAEHPKSKPRMRIIQTNLRGRTFKFITSPGVFSKKRIDLGTRVLIESMLLPDEGLLLDLGCGYGAVGIVAAALNPKLCVIMVDVNERAIWLAKRNIQLNNIYNAEVRKGSLYEPVEGFAFNAILSNPPVSAGMETMKAIIAEAPRHMANKANLQMVVRSKIWGKRLRTFFEESFGNVGILAIKSGYRVLIAEKH